jgi:hypothetical protein
MTAPKRGRGWRSVRVMKATRSSTCPICRGPVEVGQQITSRDRGPWQHIEHVIERQHNASTQGGTTT